MNSDEIAKGIIKAIYFIAVPVVVVIALARLRLPWWGWVGLFFGGGAIERCYDWSKWRRMLRVWEARFGHADVPMPSASIAPPRPEDSEARAPSPSADKAGADMPPRSASSPMDFAPTRPRRLSYSVVQHPKTERLLQD